MQGFITAKFEAGRQMTDLRDQHSFSDLSLARLLYVLLPFDCSLRWPQLVYCSSKTRRLCLNDALSAEELNILFRVDLKKRFPELNESIVRQSNDIRVSCKQQLETQLDDARAKTANASKSLPYAVHQAVVKEVLQLYP